MIMDPWQRLSDFSSLHREDIPSTPHDLISDEFIHGIDGYALFEQRYPSQSYMQFFKKTRESFEATDEIGVSDRVDLAILLFLSGRAHRHGDIGQPYWTNFTTALANKFLDSLPSKKH
ncbi:hypothetical protein JX580_04620 [Thiomicrospira microaerophila]|uniref:hypothetical protein n=1 Tax=Thiomicrospira microaerophila TaxID=406020 RepID=UPI00200E8A60|nr:hypothetical protein [Thiomicrospira microaerophila]UQB43165.1 hypothetical protein JX580_04620 [Thiomicrospira microaerophila]